MTHRPLPAHHLFLGHSFSEPAWGEGGEALFFVRLADGRRSLVRQSLASGLTQTLTAEPAPAGGVGYGQGLYAVRGQVLVYAAAGGTLQGLDLTTGEQWTVTPKYEGVASPAFSPCGQFVAFLAEGNGRCNVLMCDVRGRTLPLKLSADPWYAFNPVFSGDGLRLAWMEWEAEAMPWDESQLVIATFARPTGQAKAAYEALPITCATLAKPGVSYGAPQFSPGGKLLAYVSDESGWRSLYVAEADGHNPQRLETGEGEIGGPDWVPGRFPARWSADSQRLYAIRRHHSQDRLLSVQWPERTVTELEVPWTALDGLAVRGDQLAFVAAGPTTPPVVATLEGGRAVARAASGVGLVDAAALSTPQVIHWATAGDAVCWGLWFPAVGPQAAGPRPLLVHVHGGPTSETPLTWHAQAQYFATRGWHYLMVNHRGSTGFGRAYQDLLRGQWGVVDVQDARSGAEHLIAQGVVDPQRVALTGGSAGGYTTLMALTQDPGFWAAGVALYGIGELYELKLGSHRFEVNYEHGLIGPLPATGRLWVERSPLTYAKHVRAAVLLFHGKEDKAVPYQQSVAFADALRKNGAPVELVLYEGEGHGFGREANRRDCLEKTERFLEKYVINQQR